MNTRGRNRKNHCSKCGHNHSPVLQDSKHPDWNSCEVHKDRCKDHHRPRYGKTRKDKESGKHTRRLINLHSDPVRERGGKQFSSKS